MNPEWEDVLVRAEPFLAVCGPCEYGVLGKCMCPDGDYRPVMLELVEELKRLREPGESQGSRYRVKLGLYAGAVGVLTDSEKLTMVTLDFGLGEKRRFRRDSLERLDP